MKTTEQQLEELNKSLRMVANGLRVLTAVVTTHSVASGVLKNEQADMLLDMLEDWTDAEQATSR